MDAAFEAKLIECLDALANGEPLEAILRRYPHDAAALRPMLETAQQLSHMPVGYSVAAQRASRQAFLSQASQLRGRSRRLRFLDGFRWPGLPQFAPSLAAAALVLILISAAIFALLNDRQGGNNTLSPGEATSTPTLTRESTVESTEYPENTTTATPTPTTTAEPSAVTPSATATIRTKTATPTMTASPSPTPARPTYTPSATASDIPITPVITPDASVTLEQETPTVDPDPEPTEEDDEDEDEEENGGGSGGDGENEND